MYPRAAKDFSNIVLEDGVLVVDTPPAPDLDMLADALVTFAETHFDPLLDGDLAEVFSWTELAQDQFEDACLARMRTQGAAFLQAVWAHGRLGIVARSQRLSKTEWEQLFAELIASQEDVANPFDGWTASFQKNTALPKVDRRQPIRATPAQQTYLQLSALQDQKVHPTVAIPPIYLTSPNVPALEATFEVLQERYEILHMSFVEIEGDVFLRLSDNEPLPFSVKRTFGFLHKIENLAKRGEATLTRRISQTSSLWNARLIRQGSRAVLVCVLSETIADPQTAIMLRDDILDLYDWFKKTSGPEPSKVGSGVQFLDAAAAERDLDPALAWWDKLPLGRRSAEVDPVSEVAPVVVWEHTLPAALCARLEAQTQSTQAVIFRVFLQLLEPLDGSVPEWLLVRNYGLRPHETPNLLGQFSLDVPIWLGGLTNESTVKDSAARVTTTMQQGALSLRELSIARPNSLPDRIPYLFDWRPQKPSPTRLALPQDVTLRVWHEDEEIKTQWAIRRDHPLSLQESSLRASFQRELANLVDL